MYGISQFTGEISMKIMLDVVDVTKIGADDCVIQPIDGLRIRQPGIAVCHRALCSLNA